MTKCCQVVFQAVVPWESCTRSHASGCLLSRMDCGVPPVDLRPWSTALRTGVAQHCHHWC
jgi:hypothetical protein